MSHANRNIWSTATSYIGVGKSMLTTKYINGKFSDEYDPTIEDSYRKQCNVDGETCTLEILDTAGQEEYAAMRDYQIRSGDCFVIVYSINDLDSFEEAKIIARRIPEIKETDHVPMVLVGNKCDKTDRDVTTRDGITLARKIHSGFYEASARENIRVNDVFIQCVRRIKTYRKLADPPSNGGTPTKLQDSRTMSFRDYGSKGSAKQSSGSKSWIPTRKPSTKAKAIPSPHPHKSMPDYYTLSFAPATQQRASITAANKRRQSKRKGPDAGAKMSISSPIDSKRLSVKASGQLANNGRIASSSLGNSGPVFGDYTLVDIVKRNDRGGAVGGLPNIRMPGRQGSLKRAPESDLVQPTKRRIDHTSLSVVECGAERHVFLSSAADINKSLPMPLPDSPPKLQAAIRQTHRQKSSPNCPIL
ncbi:RAS1 protein [Coemansia sp. RSA 1646]|nr:RAS1 protein [Coemansia sp. RSA 1646]